MIEDDVQSGVNRLQSKLHGLCTVEDLLKDRPTSGIDHPQQQALRAGVHSGIAVHSAVRVGYIAVEATTWCVGGGAVGTGGICGTRGGHPREGKREVVRDVMDLGTHAAARREGEPHLRHIGDNDVTKNNVRLKQ